jgi:hypothetical protein
MVPSSIRAILVATMVAALPVVATGCYAEVQAEPVAAYGYTPVYTDDGYMVYYDDYGAPYYYSGGRQVYVPRTYVGYNRLNYHYRTYGPSYRRWYGSHGYRYRTYRRR